MVRSATSVARWSIHAAAVSALVVWAVSSLGLWFELYRHELTFALREGGVMVYWQKGHSGFETSFRLITYSPGVVWRPQYYDAFYFDSASVTRICPLWPLAVLGLASWASSLRRKLLLRRALAQGRCTSCGYDLRASVGRPCPECGAKAQFAQFNSAHPGPAKLAGPSKRRRLRRACAWASLGLSVCLLTASRFDVKIIGELNGLFLKNGYMVAEANRFPRDSGWVYRCGEQEVWSGFDGVCLTVLEVEPHRFGRVCLPLWVWAGLSIVWLAWTSVQTAVAGRLDAHWRRVAGPPPGG